MPPKKSSGNKAAPKKGTSTEPAAFQQPTPLPTRQSHRQRGLKAPDYGELPPDNGRKRKPIDGEDYHSDASPSLKRRPPAKPSQAKKKSSTRSKKAPVTIPDEEEDDEEVEDVAPKGKSQKTKNANNTQAKASGKRKRRVVSGISIDDDEEGGEGVGGGAPKRKRQKSKSVGAVNAKMVSPIVISSDSPEPVARSGSGSASKGKKESPKGGPKTPTPAFKAKTPAPKAKTPVPKAKTPPKADTEKKASPVYIAISSDEDEAGGAAPARSSSGRGSSGKKKSVSFADGDEGSPKGVLGIDKGKGVDKGKGKAAAVGGRKRGIESVEEEPVGKRPKTAKRAKKGTSLSIWQRWIIGAEGLEVGENPERFILDRGPFRQMAWADELFDTVFKELAPDARRQDLSNFEAVRALALSLEEDEVLTRDQTNNLVRHWAENKARLPGTARKALIKWEGLSAEKKEYSDEALIGFSRTKYPALLLALRKRNEMTVQEMDMVIARWAAINEDLVRRGSAPEPLSEHKEGVRHYNGLLRELRRHELAESRGKPAPDTSLGHYMYLGSIRTPMHNVPPGMRKAHPSPDTGTSKASPGTPRKGRSRRPNPVEKWVAPGN
ncbi:hypothetical protein QBC34DRAFT_376685 [Podospora aff. communis PSN243]|uniref:HMG box domain-containing protein n=1 Tax=Podospora aff. communis PSN243 TaxID=3040156 RepID=A0AAV9GXQ4_9PEZI|nr:hypothetical protein QBC34DRAFT_376685 [Podospora aff. communis PSN243]